MADVVDSSSESTSNVISFNSAQPISPGEPNQVLIELIEDVLERAKSGELQSFIGTGWTRDECRLTLICDTHPDVYQMLGALVFLQSEYISRHNSPLS